MTLFEIQARDIRGPHTQYLYPWSDIGGIGRGLKGEPVSKWAGKQASKQTNKQKRAGGVAGPHAIPSEHIEQLRHAIKRIWIASCTSLVSIVGVSHLPIMGNNVNNVTLLSYVTGI